MFQYFIQYRILLFVTISTLKGEDQNLVRIHGSFNAYCKFIEKTKYVTICKYKRIFGIFIPLHNVFQKNSFICVYLWNRELTKEATMYLMSCLRELKSLRVVF